MMLFHSPLTMALLALAAALALIGAGRKRGQVLSFFGAMAAVCACAHGLLTGASQQETVVYLLLITGVFALGDRLGRGREG